MQTLHFLYHEIQPAKGDYTYALDLEEFEAQAAFLAQCQQAAELKPAAANDLVKPAITFDDGHLSNYEYALPVLERLSLSARFFITAGWTGTRADYMGWPELRALQQAGQQIGAHGWSHQLLTHCTRDELRRELVDTRKSLEDGLGIPVTTMSLPGGRFNRRVLLACRDAGYERVFTSEPKAQSEIGNQTPQDPLIGRVNLLASSDVILLKKLLAPGSNELAALERSYRLKRTAKLLLGDTLYAKVWAIANGGKGEESQDEQRPGTP